MTSDLIADGSIVKRPGEEFVCACILTDELGSMDGDPTISTVEYLEAQDEEGDITDEISISSVSKNAEIYVDSEGESHAAGNVIFFRVSEGIAGRTYTVWFSVVTTGTPSQTIEPGLIVEVRKGMK